MEKKLYVIYSEQHPNGFENFIIKDPYTNNYYSLLYNKDNDINTIFTSQDDLYKFNFVVGHEKIGIKRGYIEDQNLTPLFDSLSKPFEQYFEWIIS
jgi:hypothetical protein